MPAQLTTRQQVNGYRFLLRRLEHALMRRDVRMLHDPMRSHIRSTMVGIALTVLIVGACAIYGLIKPAGSMGDSKIVVSKESGGLYVLVDDTLHPVLNVASARLIIGSPDKPKSISEKKLSGYKRGPLVGIPGAPQSLPGPADSGHSYWAVCDTALVPEGTGSVPGGVSTTVLGAAPENKDASRALDGSEGLFVQLNDKKYLLTGGKRFLVDTQDPSVERAFGLGDATVRPVSAGMLNAFPDADELTTPDIENRGKQSSTGLGAVGTVIQVTGVANAAPTLYVVLRDSIQQVSQTAADVIRYSDDASGGEVKTVAPAAITDTKQTKDLPLGDFPASAPKVVEQKDAPVGCLAWDKGGDSDAARLRIFAGKGLPLDDGKKPVELATSDGSGPGLDGAFIPPSTGVYVLTTGSDPDSPRRESLIFVSDAGVRFGVADEKTGQSLGLGDQPQVAPWNMVGLLPPGPALSQHNALVERDSVEASAEGATLQAGSDN